LQISAEAPGNFESPLGQYKKNRIFTMQAPLSLFLMLILLIFFPVSSIADPPSANPENVLPEDGVKMQSEPSSDARPNTFGSRIVLETCWTEEELKGTPSDKETVRGKKPDTMPPAGTFPKYQNPPLPDNLRNSIRSVKPDGGKKIVALTFDLCEPAGEKSGYDAEIVNYLRENRVKATFFAGGKWMRSHPEKTMQLMADPFFEIGNHTWTHGNLRVLKGEIIREQILWTQAQYELLRNELIRKPCIQGIDENEIGKIPQGIAVFRFPYGACGPESLSILAEHGLPAIQWSIVTGDPARKQTAKNIGKTILTQIKPGAVIICHANGRGHGTAQSLPLFIPELKKRGYSFVTVSELLRSGRIVSVKECYEIKPGDNYRYDKKVGTGLE
jgi:peptidoglycan/xylan/chitin deacetylase (PgdA/CDA1 family)